jgi:hypothetical protein
MKCQWPCRADADPIYCAEHAPNMGVVLDIKVPRSSRGGRPNVKQLRTADTRRGEALGAYVVEHGPLTLDGRSDALQRAVAVAERAGVIRRQRDGLWGADPSVPEAKSAPPRTKLEPVASPKIKPAPKLRTTIDYNALADRLVAIVEATPVDQLPVTRDRARAELGVTLSTYQRVVALVLDDGRIRSMRGEQRSGYLPATITPASLRLREAIAFVAANPGCSLEQIGQAVGATARTVEPVVRDAVQRGDLFYAGGSPRGYFTHTPDEAQVPRRTDRQDRDEIADRLVALVRASGRPVGQRPARAGVGVGHRLFQESARVALQDGRLRIQRGPGGGYVAAEPLAEAA